VPIEVAAAGPRTLGAAATLADRIQLTVGAAPERIRWALSVIEAALSQIGRARSELRIGALIPLVVDSSRTSAAERLRTGVAVIAHMASLPGMNLAEQPARLRAVTERLRVQYDYRHHNMEQDNPMRDLVDTDFADWFGVGGPPTYITQRLGELAAMGVEYFVFGTIPRAEREILAADVMPQLR
jgi:alkanesulfonate monooxygenase SsuD/methylene tetrahydromethanopterin reductase-like flavin-dependent oxidoreductase (luciferase family)